LELMNMTEDMPVQLDHVLVNTSVFRVVDGTAQVTMKDRVTVNGELMQCSDHYGVCATLTLKDGADVPVSNRGVPDAARLLSPDFNALSFGASFLDRSEANLYSVMMRINVVAILVLSVTVAAWLYLDFTGVFAMVWCFFLGFGTAAGLITAHFHRRFDAITMRDASDDLHRIAAKRN
jgi:hypothetical protein